MSESRERMIEKARVTYNYCGICGHRPSGGVTEEPNYAPLRWWDCDDGWKIGSLCRACWQEVCDDQPKPDDYAFRSADDQRLDNVNTDEDPIEAFEDHELA